MYLGSHFFVLFFSCLGFAQLLQFRFIAKCEKFSSIISLNKFSASHSFSSPFRT